MKMNYQTILKIILLTMFINQSFALGGGKIEKLNWNGLDVVYIEDSRFPTYNVAVYFGDGALSDRGEYGISTAMFDLLKSGTRRFGQKDIADNLEFFGASTGARVTHEYSIYNVSGLVKDAVPTMKKVCHLFKDATFPKKELKKYQKRLKASLQSLINNHGALASRAFREISLKGTPYNYPTGGKVSDIRRFSQQRLNKKLNYYNKEVKKRVYITGPRKILDIAPIINQECAWKGEGNFVRNTSYKEITRAKPHFVLVTVPRSNQAQVRIGRLLNKGEYENDELLSLTSEYLGGGFTSKLMRELRVKRGLTYSVGAHASGQKQYGRAIISTFTKNKTLDQLIMVTKDTIHQIASGDFPIKELDRAKGNLAGGYPFRFEVSSAYLSQLMFLDHVGKSYDELYGYPEQVRKFTSKEVATSMNNIFGWDKQTIVVVGSRNLLKQLKKFGPVEVVSFKNFL